VRGSIVALVAVAAVVLAGCGATVDTAKQTFPRSTVPAGQFTGEKTTATGEPKANDPAFANEEIIKLEPCALLTEDILASVGEPDENKPENYGNCSNYMKDKDGKSLYLTLYVGETISDAQNADQNIGGLPAFESELDDGSACFVNAVTSTDPNFGIRIQAGGEGKDLCPTATKVLTSVIEKIREDPPEREAGSDSIAGVDPCTLLDAAAVKTALGGVEVTTYPYTLHWCNWVGDNVTLNVWFRTGSDPKGGADNATPVDLGDGVTAYQSVKASPSVSCRLEWLHRSTGTDGADEIVEVEYENTQPPSGDNGCASVTEVAKLLIPKLPKS
jgi:hypothetical protein